jgi:3-hydroxyisobutyrate dehydrogenase-like beta-hydroxyacid dehydrogenase
MGTASALDTRRIGWIGLGKMGLPICERLAAQGFEVATLTRNPEGRERATRANLQSESKIGDVVASADIVVSAISDDAALLDIVFQAGGLKETLDVSQLFVEISTVSPSASRRVAEAMSAIGVGYIRSPVSGSTALAAQGALTAVISGPAGALASLKDVTRRSLARRSLSAMGRKLVISSSCLTRWSPARLRCWRKPWPWVVREGSAMLR